MFVYPFLHLSAKNKQVSFQKKHLKECSTQNTAKNYFKTRLQFIILQINRKFPAQKKGKLQNKKPAIALYGYFPVRGKGRQAPQSGAPHSPSFLFFMCKKGRQAPQMFHVEHLPLLRLKKALYKKAQHIEKKINNKATLQIQEPFYRKKPHLVK